MIQFNLLPDVKLQYIKAAKAKRMVISVAVLASLAVVIVVGGLSFVVMGLQKSHLSNLNKDIKTQRQKLEESEDINKILTVQSQLNELNDLHEQKPTVSRLFDYLNKLTPDAVTLSSVRINFDEQTVEIAGNSPAIREVNRFVDTLKFTEFTEAVVTEEDEEEKAEPQRAFSEVVMANFSKANGGMLSYKVTFKYDPLIFDDTRSVELITPHGITTRSELEKPSQVFLNVPEEQE